MNNKYRNDFPLLQQQNRGKVFSYLDSSATSQKPISVIKAIENYYSCNNANIHRGVYELSQRATKCYEDARENIKEFINAKNSHEIIFVRGATEGINLVAQCYGRERFKAGDEIIISAMEHHSNIVPWQIVSKQCDALLRVIPISDEGELDLDAFKNLLTARTKIVAITHASNALGTINPVKQIIEIAHEHDVPVLIDGAQAIPHVPVDVTDLDCDFYVFSAHKAYGPTGVGVLYGKEKFLDNMPPYQSGGDMIESVSFEGSTYNKLPYKFEAGTPNISGVIGFNAALNYLRQIGMKNVVLHEQQLLSYATQALSTISDLKIIGTAKEKVGVISFVLNNIHPHDIGTILDSEGVAVRAGHHCAMPLMNRFNVPATVRSSFGVYSTKEDIDALIAVLRVVTRIFC